MERPTGELKIGFAGWRVAPEYLAIVVLGLFAVVIFAPQPTFPSYDGYYSLAWAREIAAGSLPSFEVPAAPTEHPLAILIALVSLPFGEHAERVYVLVAIASFIALALAVNALGAVLFSRLVGFLAALIVLTRFDLIALAARGFIDIPFLALVIWSAVIVARSGTRRSPMVVGLMVLAGLCRPEAWLFSGAYLLYAYREIDRSLWVKLVALAAVAPLAWFAVDWIVTGNPLFSLTATRELAGQLGRSRSFGSVVLDLPTLVARTVKMSILIAGLGGLALGLLALRRRMAVPLAVATIGLGTFLLTSAVGLSINLRYLSAVSVIICLGAGLALGGWTVVDQRWRRAAIGLAVVCAALLLVRLPSNHKDFDHLRDSSRYVHSQHDSLFALLGNGAMQQRIRSIIDAGSCVLTVPGHQTVPVVREALRFSAAAVVPSTFQEQPPVAGVQLIATDARFKVQPGPVDRENVWANSPAAGFKLIAKNRSWSLYGRGGSCAPVS